MTVKPDAVITGNYSGKVTISGNAPSSSVRDTVDIPISMTKLPALVILSHTLLDFSHSDTIKPLVFANPRRLGPNSTNWDLIQMPPWIKLKKDNQPITEDQIAPRAGDSLAVDSLEVVIDRNGLAPGIYQDTLGIRWKASDPIEEDTATIQLAMSVEGVTVIPSDSVEFSAVSFEEPFVILNRGRETLTWAIRKIPDWITLKPDTLLSTVAVAVPPIRLLIVVDTLSTHPFASLTITVYIPGERPVAVVLLCTGVVFHM